MNQFFNAVIILSILFLGLIVYYVAKNYVFKLRREHRGTLLFDKIYQDEKTYFRNRLKLLLLDLATGKIQWLLVYSRLFPEDRIQITYSSIEQAVQMVQYSRGLNVAEQEYLHYLGVNRYRREQGRIILLAASNSKIITDLVYFMLEKIYNQKKTHNLKINISGE